MSAITKSLQRSALVGGSSFAMKWELSQVPALRTASITYLISPDISFSFIVSLTLLQSQSPSSASFQFIPTCLINSQTLPPSASILLLYNWSLLISQGTVILLTQSSLFISAFVSWYLSVWHKLHPSLSWTALVPSAFNSGSFLHHSPGYQKES